MSEIPGQLMSAYPGHSEVIRPEFCRHEVLSGLNPGSVVYPGYAAFGVDTNSGAIYVSGNFTYGDSDMNPSYMQGRAGLSRIYEKIGGRLVDGFIADFRWANPGEFYNDAIAEAVAAAARDEYTEGKANSLQLLDYRPLMAAMFKDPEGRPHFRGDVRLRPHVDAVCTLTDRLAATFEGQAAVEPKKAPIHRLPSGVFGEFLG